MRNLRFICTLLLIFVGFQLQAQKSEATLLAYQADSLSFCGYFDQELEVRNRLLVSLDQSSSEFRKQNLLLQIAKYNQNSETSSEVVAYDAFRAIVKKYQLFPKKEKKDVAVEVGRLISVKLIELERITDGILLLKKMLSGVNKSSVDAALLNLNIGQALLNSQQKYYASIPYFKAAIAGFESNGMANHYANALGYSELSFSYDRAEVEYLMFECSEKALEIWRTYYFKDAEIVSTAFNNMIADMIDYGDRYAAEKHQKTYEKYMAKYFEAGKANYRNTSNEFSTLGLFYLTAVKYYAFDFDAAKIREAVTWQEQLFSRAPKKWKENEFGLLLSTYDSACYGFYFNYESAEALRYNELMERNANSDFYFMKAAANRAMLYYYKYDYAKALTHTEKSLSYLELLGYRSSYKTLLTLKAELLANLGEITGAKNTLSDLYRLQFDEKINFKKLRIADYADIASSSDINILIHSGLAYRAIYEKDGKKKEDLTVMKNFYRVAAQMFQNYYLKGLFNPDLDRQLNNIKEGLLFGYVQEPTDKAFLTESINYIENNASQHLWKQFLSKHSQNINVPKEILAQKNQLSMELTFLENKTELSSNEIKKVADLRAELLAVETEITNPNYKRFSSANFEVQSLQKSELLIGSALVKFAVTDSSVYGLKMVASTTELVYLGKRDEIEKAVKLYYAKLRSIDFDYRKESQKLYHLLLEPLRLEPQHKLIIVAEYFLNFVPFEALISAENETGEIPVISYMNSLKAATFAPQKSIGSFSYVLAGFAPEYPDNQMPSRSESGQLIYTGKELDKIAKKIGKAAVFVKDQATKKNFIGSLGQSKIHHLAMHSLLNEEDYNYSSLVFQNDEKLYFHELYDLNFQSEMVVLSACNTGIGQYLSGEGFMSISRALNYAGVKATVYSLWQVPDKETSELMVLFYENIENGLPKDEALTSAKRQFIENFPTKSHPYYWAGFVINGDVNAIENDNYWVYIVGAIFVFSVVIFFIRRRILLKNHPR